MTKWVALALGALLALGGAVSIWNGVDVIQSERGWVSVIAGSVSLAGGIMTFALFLAIRELQALRSDLALALASIPADVAVPEATAVPAPMEEPAPAAPIIPAHPAPPPAPADSVPAASPVVEPEPKEPPLESLAFDQVFPPVPLDSPPAAPVRERFRFRASEAAVGIAAGAAAIGIFSRSRADQAASDEPAQHAPEVRLPSDTPDETASHPSVEVSAQSESDQHSPQETPESVEAPAEDHHAELAAPADEAPDAGGEEAQDQSGSVGYAWLERALARDEGPKSPALEWLRSRPPTTLLIDPPAAGQQVESEEADQKSAQEAPSAAEAGTDQQAPQTHEPAPVEVEAAQETAESAPAPTAEPGVIGRYSSGGSDYTLYSDGSIDAQTDQGLFRFESMAELRAYIEAQNAQS